MGLNGERIQADALKDKLSPAIGPISRLLETTKESLRPSQLQLLLLTLHLQASDIPLRYSCPRAHGNVVVMLRRVLVVAGLAQLSRPSASLARTQCRHLVLASRSRPSASPLGKPWLHHGTKPLRSLSAAHCFSSSTTTTTVRATPSPSINHLEEGFDASLSLKNVLSWSQGDSLSSSSSSASVISEAIPGMLTMVVLVAQLRYARISFRLLYRYLLCVGSSLAYVAPSPTPTRDSSVDEVKAWLAWYGISKLGASEEELAALQVAGNILLSFTKEDCLRRSRNWGDAIYHALRRGTVSIYLSIVICGATIYCTD